MKYLNVVHLVDTEGPLYEPLKITFDRINEIFGIKIQPNKKNLKKIIDKKIDLKLKKNLKKNFFESFNSEILTYKKNWNEIKEQNNYLFTKKFRTNFKDSFGNYWKINWNCVDHVNYASNPQKRALGYHKIFDYYKKKSLNQKLKTVYTFIFTQHLFQI